MSVFNFDLKNIWNRDKRTFLKQTTTFDENMKVTEKFNQEKINQIIEFKENHKLLLVSWLIKLQYTI